MSKKEKPDNLVQLFETSVASYPNHRLFGTKASDGAFHWLTYREAGRRVDALRGALARLGVGKADAVGVIANNCSEWALIAFATYGRGARFVPMYEKELPQIWRHIINDSGVKVLLVSKPSIMEKVKQQRDTMPGLAHLFLIDGQGPETMAALEADGAAHPVASRNPAPEDVAGLIYTSGTTGNPKGVLLTHGNFTSNAQSGTRIFPELTDTSRSLSILPWAHSYGQTAELYGFILRGGSIGFMESVETLSADLVAVQPTFLIAVPRVFNKIYDTLTSKMAETGGVAKKLFDMGMASARRRRENPETGGGWANRIKLAIADALVFKKIRARFGGRLQGALVASATMNVEVAHFFSDIGIPVFDCYGLTETSPAVTMNCPAAHRPGSVGRPIDGVRLVIDASVVEPGAGDGEIVVYGPNVMAGYHNDPAATAAVMTPDGGFRTGDRGWIDDDGYLFITGRIKEQYKLENGKYVFPAALEEEIRLLPWVENAMVYGDGRAFNVCLVIPDMDAVARWGKTRGLAEDATRLVLRKDVQDMISADITGFLKGKFGGYEIPKQFVFVQENFSLESGTLTQTMKVKRKAVVSRYQEHIDAAYRK